MKNNIFKSYKATVKLKRLTALTLVLSTLIMLLPAVTAIDFADIDINNFYSNDNNTSEESPDKTEAAIPPEEALPPEETPSEEPCVNADVVRISDIQVFDKDEMEEKLNNASFDYLIEEKLVEGVVNLDPGAPKKLTEVSVKNLEIVNFILVKQTLVDAAVTPADYTIDDVMTSEKMPEMFLTMNATTMPVYDPGDDSGYFIAFIDTMNDDTNNEIQDWCVAYNDLDGRVIDDAWVDTDEGIIYIPAYIYESDDILGEILRVQVQLLQRVGRTIDEAASAYDLINMTGDKAELATWESGIFNFETTIETSKNLNPNHIVLIVNGMEVDEEYMSYDPETGLITLYMSPASVQSVVVNIDAGREEDLMPALPYMTEIASFSTSSSTYVSYPTSGMFDSYLIAEVGDGVANNDYHTANVSISRKDPFNYSAMDETIRTWMYKSPTGSTWTAPYQEHTVQTGRKILDGVNAYDSTAGYINTSKLQDIPLTRYGDNSGNYFIAFTNMHLGNISIGSGSKKVSFIGGVSRTGGSSTIVPGLCTQVGQPMNANDSAYDVVIRFFNIDHDNGTGFAGIVSKSIPPDGVQSIYALVPIKWYVDHLKNTEMTIEKINESGRVLSGAQFRVTGNGINETKTTSSNGQAKIPLSRWSDGTYTVTEITPPAGYKLSNPVSQTFTISNGGRTVTPANLKLTFRNNPHQLQIIKQNEDNERLSGAQFRITGNGKNQLVNGNTTISLAGWTNGTYTVTEETPPAGYELSQPVFQRFTLNGNTLTPSSLTFKNSPHELEIIKLSDDGEILHGAKFRIAGPVAEDAYDETANEKDNEGEEVEEETEEAENGEEEIKEEPVVYLKDEIADGNSLFSLAGWPDGIYMVTEVLPPSGYSLSAKKQFFTLDGNDLTPQALTFKNKPLELVIMKASAHEPAQLLDGAMFKITKKAQSTADEQTVEDIDEQIDDRIDINPAGVSGTAGEEETADVDKDDESGDYEGETSDVPEEDKPWEYTLNAQDGVYRVNLGGWETGTYIVTEITPPNGYALDGSPMEFEIIGDGTLSANALTFTNQSLMLYMEKLCADTGVLLPGAHFNISGMDVDLDIILKDGSFSLDLAGWETGIYTVIETVPPNGYALDSTPQEFEIIGDGTLSADALTFTNQPLMLYMEKLCADTGDLLPGTRFHISGIDADIAMDVEFEDGTYLLDLSGWKDGEYLVMETEPPPGYLLDSEPLTFTIENGALSVEELSFENHAEPEPDPELEQDPDSEPEFEPEPDFEIPQTGGFSIPGIVLVSMIASCFGVIALLEVYKRRERAANTYGASTGSSAADSVAGLYIHLKNNASPREK